MLGTPKPSEPIDKARDVSQSNPVEAKVRTGAELAGSAKELWPTREK